MRTSFYKDPVRFLKGLFTKQKSRSLKVPKRELEDHLKEPTQTAKDLKRRRYHPTCCLFLNQVSEVKEAVKKARAASAPGPNGVP